MKKRSFLILINALITFFFIFFSYSEISAEEKNYDYIAIDRMDYFGYLDTDSSIILEYDNRIKTKNTVDNELKGVKDILLGIETNFSMSKTLYMNNANIESSKVMIINERSGKNTPTTVDDEFLELLGIALEVSQIPNSGFDPTIGALTSLWDISEKSKTCANNSTCTIPTNTEIQEAITLVDYKNVIIDEEQKTVSLKTTGMKLDFGAIAKGYAADLVLRYLLDCGYDMRISISLGGNIYNYGSSPLNTGFQTLLRNPFDIDNPLLGIQGTDHTIVTSGIYERYIDVDGIRYHHILNPSTGYPFDNELESVTIVNQYQEGIASSAYADSYATAMYGLGLEESLTFVNSKPNLEAIFITKDKKVYVTEGQPYEIKEGLTKEFQLYVGNEKIEFEPIRDMTDIDVYVMIALLIIAGFSIIGLVIVIRNKNKKIEE